MLSIPMAFASNVFGRTLIQGDSLAKQPAPLHNDVSARRSSLLTIPLRANSG
jgi:hypothetical protein